MHRLVNYPEKRAKGEKYDFLAAVALFESGAAMLC